MQYWEAILDALIDTAKVVPILLIVYYLIEFIEYKYAVKFQNNKLLKGKASPVIGSLIGCIPQCGFSVVSTDLYSKGIISVGALIAVYIATSDEALPLMISEPKSIPWLFALIGIKIVVGIIVGYIANLLYGKIFKPKTQPQENAPVENIATEDTHVEVEEHHGCCHHHVESKKFDWWHPLLHCLKITLYILVVNILFNFVTHIWVGEEALLAFLSQSRWLQPLLAVLIGLIPNCASSLAVTELFLMGGLTFGALTAGLCVNAGLGLIILFKRNKKKSENLFIVSTLIITSLIVGYLLNFI